jgi:SAM-dependent methyltransferase
MWKRILARGRNKSEVPQQEQTATRHVLTTDWQETQQKIDWMSAPTMAQYVNRLVSGRDLQADGHWAIYARDRYILPLKMKRGASLSMVSLACGEGHIEEALINHFGWPIASFTGLEFDAELRKRATQRFKEIRECQSEFYFFDFNDEDFVIPGHYDIVFACHSLHHAADLELLLENANRMLKPDGLFVGIDYFGPTRFQIEYDVLPIIEELFSYLPPELRRNLQTPDHNIEDTFIPPSLDNVKAADISESVRSSDLRTLLFSNFPVVEIKPMGGTILRWLLQYRAGNFDWQNPEHVSIVRLLQFIERELILSRRIKSDDLFFVLSKSDRLPG